MAASPYTFVYCFDFFAPQNVALLCNLVADLVNNYPYLPTKFERLSLIFLWLFDLIGYHADELEKLPSSWPEWIAPVALLVGSLLFYVCGIVIISRLSADKQDVPAFFLACSALIYFFVEWHDKPMKETYDRHGKNGVGTYTHLSFLVFQMSVVWAKRKTTKEKKS